MRTLSAAQVAPLPYRAGRFESAEGLFHRCLLGASAGGLLFITAVLLAPIRAMVLESRAPEPVRLARLVMEKPAPLPPVTNVFTHPEPVVARPGGGAAGPSVATPAAASPGPGSVARNAGGGTGSAPGPDDGSAGRLRAQQAVGGQVAGALSSLERSLQGLSSALQSTNSSSGSGSVAGSGRGRRVRGVQSGRSDAELASISSDIGGGGTADLGGTVLQGSLVAIGTLSAGPGGGGGNGGGGGGGTGPGGSGGMGGGAGGGVGGGVGSGFGAGVGGGEGGGGSGGGGAGAGPGVYRSNASLLAVIQKYAAGIQYCYGNELKRREGLRGKLVVALTVSASGDVLEARIVQDTMGSDRLASCALAQIRDWKFASIPEGVTTFQAPFVFTPPN